MLPWLRAGANPGSPHALGRAAAAGVEEARAQVAALVGGDPAEIVFTSGATEAANLAVHAAAGPGRILAGATEHEAVLAPVRARAGDGLTLDLLPVDREGRIDPAAVEAALGPDVQMLALMAVNNEVGTIHALDRLAGPARERGIPILCDAAQAWGKIRLAARALPVDYLLVSGHKMHGPPGSGALWVRPGAPFRPLLRGGGQERGRRAGTPDVPGIVGLGQAARIALEEGEADATRVAALAARLLAALPPGTRLNGPPPGERLPHNLNVSFSGIDGEALVAACPDLALSTGAACGTGAPGGSRVLRALGLPPERIRGSIRIGLGRFTTSAEVDRAAARLTEEAARLRALAGAA